MTPRSIPTEALTLSCICDIQELTDFSIFLTSRILELSTACFGDQGSLWSYNRAVAVRSGFAVRSVLIDVAHGDEQALAGLVGEGGKHEVVAVDVGSTLPLAFKLRFKVRDRSNEIGD